MRNAPRISRSLVADTAQKICSATASKCKMWHHSETKGETTALLTVTNDFDFNFKLSLAQGGRFCAQLSILLGPKLNLPLASHVVSQWHYVRSRSPSEGINFI